MSEQTRPPTEEKRTKKRVRCPTCGKLCARFGVSMHHLDKHGTALLKLPDPPGPSFSPNFDERNGLYD